MAETPLKLCEEYPDVYEGSQLEMVSATRFDENSDLSTMYLDRVDKGSNSKLKAEEIISNLRNIGIQQVKC